MDRTRERILDAARKLCRERGFAVEGRDIAEHAEVSEAAMYRRFPRRLDILEALLDEMLDSAHAGFCGLTGDDRRDVEDVVRGINRVGFEHLGRYGRLGSDVTTGHVPAVLLGRLDRVELLWRFMRGVIERGIAEGRFRGDLNIDVLLAAWRSLISSTDAISTFVDDAADAGAERLASLLSDFILAALRPSPRGGAPAPATAERQRV